VPDDNGKWLVCCVKGCDEKPALSGLCIDHYQRTRAYGSPVGTRNVDWLEHRLPDQERFWLNVRKGDDCWLWVGGKTISDYGKFRSHVGGVTYNMAHRYSYALHYGRNPKEFHVCHACDTPSCVRPDHLFLGTAADNVADKVSKGRGQAKLTETQVRAILADQRYYREIAADYGLSLASICRLKSREAWAHLNIERAPQLKRASPPWKVCNKLNPEIIIAIRKSSEPHLWLAKRYGVSCPTIVAVRRRETWRHIE
jgi:hypothetical protein